MEEEGNKKIIPTVPHPLCSGRKHVLLHVASPFLKVNKNLYAPKLAENRVPTRLRLGSLLSWERSLTLYIWDFPWFSWSSSWWRNCRHLQENEMWDEAIYSYRLLKINATAACYIPFWMEDRMIGLCRYSFFPWLRERIKLLITPSKKHHCSNWGQMWLILRVRV